MHIVGVTRIATLFSSVNAFIKSHFVCLFFEQVYTAASDQSAQIHTQMKSNVSMWRKQLSFEDYEFD